jgi:hypothetical protein
LHRYLAEFDFRYSNRERLGVDDVQRAALAVQGAAVASPMKRLVAQGENVRGRAERHRKRHWRGPELPGDPRQLKLPGIGDD